MLRALPCCVALLLAACSGGSVPREEAPRAEVDADWAQVPDGTVWGEVSAVDIDSHGHVFVLQRASRAWQEPFPAEPIAEPVVFMFARDGKLLAQSAVVQQLVILRKSGGEADWQQDKGKPERDPALQRQPPLG